MPTAGPTSEMSTPLSPRNTTSPEILPSLPPSPTLLEEDFSRPRVWRKDQELFEMQDSRRSPESGYSNGKGKEKQSFDEGDEEDDDDDDDTVENHGGGSHEAYPPTTDAVAETRRVEETLERWELAERQRRKSAREASQPNSGPSLLVDVTRKASLILSGRNPSLGASAGAGIGNHRALKSREFVDATREGYGVPLDDIDQHDRQTAAIVGHSPSPSVFEPITPENPFTHPSDSGDCSTPTPLLSRSPFADPKEQPAVMTESVFSPTPFSRESLDTKTRRGRAQPTMLAPTVPLVPPPRPLGLPPPATPPPPAPQVTPLKPTAPPVLSPPPREDPEDRKEVRWWHEWLCGCGEGPDRGGDNQAGRTNPFE
ncbi:hypothetical protein PAXINDRAFT_179122 [Paxillus involutus ATCC 200175]|nr:hypothetical protein PAXINDRAFT_179122 [Paxillus involutus ATCC 200175]